MFGAPSAELLLAALPHNYKPAPKPHTAHINPEFITTSTCSYTLNNCTTTQVYEHPAWKQLRQALHHQGYIQASWNSWNGDVVLQPFTLNNYQFQPGHRFPSPEPLLRLLDTDRYDF